MNKWIENAALSQRSPPPCQSTSAGDDVGDVQTGKVKSGEMKKISQRIWSPRLSDATASYRGSSWKRLAVSTWILFRELNVRDTMKVCRTHLRPIKCLLFWIFFVNWVVNSEKQSRFPAPNFWSTFFYMKWTWSWSTDLAGEHWVYWSFAKVPSQTVS